MIGPEKSPTPIIDLVPRELRNALPPLDSQEGVSDPIVYARFQSRDTNWIWYVTEGSPQDDDFLFFGLVIGLEIEWGYFSLSELTEARPPWEFPIERDLHFKPTSLSRVVTRNHR
jgi:Protein of unknown function (DUF2958)